MTTPARAVRVDNALQVIERMHNGMTVIDACQEVGLPRSTFYDIIKKNPEAIAAFQKAIENSNLEQLGLDLANKNNILRKVIQDALSNTTTPKERIAIMKALDQKLNQLTEKVNITNEHDLQAQEFLKHGPKTSLQVSRMTTTRETVTIEDPS